MEPTYSDSEDRTVTICCAVQGKCCGRGELSRESGEHPWGKVEAALMVRWEHFLRELPRTGCA